MIVFKLAATMVIAVLAIMVAGSVSRSSHPAARRFAGHKSAIPALGWLCFMALLALLAPLLAPYRPSMQFDITALANQAPSWSHPLGTDNLSRDIWSRILHGARVSLGIGTIAALLAATIGAVVGALAGYLRGTVDVILMRLVDVGLSIPRIFLLLVIVAVTDHVGIAPLVLVLGLTGWLGTSRLVRSEVLVLREASFVMAGQALGASTARLMFRELIPNAIRPLLVAMVLAIGQVMLLEAALSFLGVGVQPPTASWGNMIADGRGQLVTAPWTTIAPGMAIVLAVMALNAVGDGLQEALDPRGNEHLQVEPTSIGAIEADLRGTAAEIA